jgi:hypothetical protein
LYTFSLIEAFYVLIYFQLFRIIVIIYQSSNVKVHFKYIEKKTNLKYIFIHFSYLNVFQTLCVAYHELNGGPHGHIMKLKRDFE